jgi:hypothetical protein
VKTHALPLQVASAFPGAWHCLQAGPHALTSLSATQLPPQSCFPDGQLPRQAWPSEMQLPAHSLVPPGHFAPQLPKMQTASPPLGTAHGVQDVPQLFTSPSLRH